jgi:hypothetical protein
MREAMTAMKNIAIASTALVALFALTACEPEVEELDSTAPDPMASQLANAAPVTLPPPISESVTFRCQPGNVLIYVDFFKGNERVNLRTEEDGAVTVLMAEEAGGPFAGSGYTFTGTPASGTLDRPEGATYTCKA